MEEKVLGRVAKVLQEDQQGEEKDLKERRRDK